MSILIWPTTMGFTLKIKTVTSKRALFAYPSRAALHPQLDTTATRYKWRHTPVWTFDLNALNTTETALTGCSKQHARTLIRFITVFYPFLKTPSTRTRHILGCSWTNSPQTEDMYVKMFRNYRNAQQNNRVRSQGMTYVHSKVQNYWMKSKT